MPINLSFAFGVPPEKAVEFFTERGYRLSWDWEEQANQAAVRAFMVAKVVRADVLEAIREAIAEALERGDTLKDFQAKLEPILKAKGWWGRQFIVDPDGNTERVQLGSPHRLRTIYRTNLQSALMQGRVADFLAVADERPYWQYSAVMDNNTRPAHRAMDGRVFRYDDPIWQSWTPPVGYNCRCRIFALSAENVKRLGLDLEESKGQTREVERSVSQKHPEIKEKAIGIQDLSGQYVFPDRGWGGDRRKGWKPDLAKYSPDVREQLARALEEIGGRDQD